MYCIAYSVTVIKYDDSSQHVTELFHSMAKPVTKLWSLRQEERKVVLVDSGRRFFEQLFFIHRRTVEVGYVINTIQ